MGNTSLTNQKVYLAEPTMALCRVAVGSIVPV